MALTEHDLYLAGDLNPYVIPKLLDEIDRLKACLENIQKDYLEGLETREDKSYDHVDNLKWLVEVTKTILKT